MLLFFFPVISVISVLSSNIPAFSISRFSERPSQRTGGDFSLQIKTTTTKKGQSWSQAGPVQSSARVGVASLPTLASHQHCFLSRSFSSVQRSSKTNASHGLCLPGSLLSAHLFVSLPRDLTDPKYTPRKIGKPTRPTKKHNTQNSKRRRPKNPGKSQTQQKKGIPDPRLDRVLRTNEKCQRGAEIQLLERETDLE